MKKQILCIFTFLLLCPAISRELGDSSSFLSRNKILTVSSTGLGIALLLNYLYKKGQNKVQKTENKKAEPVANIKKKIEDSKKEEKLNPLKNFSGSTKNLEETVNDKAKKIAELDKNIKKLEKKETQRSVENEFNRAVSDIENKITNVSIKYDDSIIDDYERVLDKLYIEVNTLISKKNEYIVVPSFDETVEKLRNKLTEKQQQINKKKRKLNKKKL